MSQYPLRSRFTMSGPDTEDDTNPLQSGGSNATSRQISSFGRGGGNTDLNTGRRGASSTAGRGGRVVASRTGRGGGIDRSRVTPRREHGVTAPRFPRTRPDVEEKVQDDVSEGIPELEDQPDEEDAVPTDVDTNKIDPTTEFDVFQAFKLPFAQTTQPEEECVFQQLDNDFDITDTTPVDDSKTPKQPMKRLTLMEDSERITVHYTPVYEPFATRLRATQVDINGANGIHFVLRKFGFKLSDSELLFLQSIGVNDVPSLLDICSLEPRPLYEHMRTNPHILDEHQDDLGALFDSRFVHFYSILSGIYTYLRYSRVILVEALILHTSLVALMLRHT
jgi:hypothetical protein